MEQIKNILIRIILIALLVLPLNNLFAQTQTERNITQEEISKLNNNRKLIAEKVDVKLETAAIDSIRILFELEEEEEEMSPADDLYDGIWNNRYVRDYANVTIPDTFRINLSSFVIPIEGKITSPFGPRRRSFHYGTDIKLYTGDTVVAAFEGKVRVRQYEKKGYGYYLVLRHPNGLETIYGHLSKFLVVEDEIVAAGQPIALGGNTGRSTGAHLHFECRFLGQAIDPADIVDFNNFCIFDEAYVFQKSKINAISKNNNNYIASNNNYTAGNQAIKYHRIQSGDSLSRISKKYGVSITTLCRLNGIRPTTILRIGRVIRYS